MAAVLERCGVLAVPRERAVFSGRSVEQDLGRLLRGSSTEQHRDVLERPLAPPAIAAVLAFSEVMADLAAHGRYSLSLYDPGRYLRLDAAAQRALNVLKGKGDANDLFSLLGLLSKGKTQMGRRLCKVRLCCSVRELRPAWPCAVVCALLPFIVRVAARCAPTRQLVSKAKACCRACGCCAVLGGLLL